MYNDEPRRAHLPHVADSFDPRTGMKRRTSEEDERAEEVAAGIALAGLGLAVSVTPPANAVGAKKGAKRSKKEEAASKAKGDKDNNRKSCSECRRLKAKCDRQFPCSNCKSTRVRCLRWTLTLGRRRGCAVVCPDGDLSCMQGKRLVLASTEQLHERVSGRAVLERPTC